MPLVTGKLLSVPGDAASVAMAERIAEICADGFGVVVKPAVSGSTPTLAPSGSVTALVTRTLTTAPSGRNAAGLTRKVWLLARLIGAPARVTQVTNESVVTWMLPLQ